MLERGATLPLPAGQNSAILAILIGLADPGIRGVLVSGSNGTGKSALLGLARRLCRENAVEVPFGTALENLLWFDRFWHPALRGPRGLPQRAAGAGGRRHPDSRRPIPDAGGDRGGDPLWSVLRKLSRLCEFRPELGVDKALPGRQVRSRRHHGAAVDRRGQTGCSSRAFRQEPGRVGYRVPARGNPPLPGEDAAALLADPRSGSRRDRPQAGRPAWRNRTREGIDRIRRPSPGAGCR